MVNTRSQTQTNKTFVHRTRSRVKATGKIKCSVKNELVANQANVFTNQSISAVREPTNEFLTAKTEIDEIQTEKHQKVIEEVTHVNDHDDTLLNGILNQYLTITCHLLWQAVPTENKKQQYK